MNLLRLPVWYLLSLFIFTSIAAKAQSPIIDSLENLLNNHPERDTVRVNLLNKIAFKQYKSKINAAAENVKNASDIAGKLQYTKGKANSLYIIGLIEIVRSNFAESKNSFESSLAKHSKIDNKKGESDCLNGIGITYFYQGKYENALIFFEKSIAKDKERGAKESAPKLMNIGSIYMQKGNFTNALKYYEDAYNLNKNLNDEIGISNCLNNMGILYEKQGDYFQAIRCYKESLIIQEELGNKATIAHIHQNIGISYRTQENYNKSLFHLKLALDEFENLKDKKNISRALSNIGVVHKKQGRLDSAMYNYKESLQISESINDVAHKSNNIGNIAFLELDRGNYNQALKNFKKGMSLKKEIKDNHGICSFHLGIAKVLYVQKKYGLALNHISKADSLLSIVNAKSLRKIKYELLSKIYYDTNEYKKAHENQVKYKALSDSLFNKESIQKITGLEYEYAYHARLDSAKHIELELTNEVAQADVYYEQSQRKMLYGIISFLMLVILLVTVISILRVRNLKSKSEHILVEQKLLRSQMTPHFIFNSISVLQGIVSNKEYDKSEVYMSKFSKLLRNVLENSKDKAVKLTDELQVIENYLAIQNLGVENLYDFKITIDENVNIDAVLVPPMIIQPFIENAIEHGFKNKGKDRKIEIKLKFEGDDLICAIEDNGVGINFYATNQSPDRKSMSTAITAKRLKMLAKQYKLNTDVKIEDRSVFNEEGTLVTLLLPYTYSIDKLIKN